MSEAPDLSELITALNRLSLAINSQNSANQGREDPETASEWAVVEDEVDAASIEQRRERVAYGDYNSFAELQPDCPRFFIAECNKLSGGGVSGEYRARRAFEAGYWAGLALAGRLARPRATRALNLQVRIYVILRAPGLTSPTRVASASDLYRITGRLDSASNVICHGFPSQIEAKAYCEGAGVPYPENHRWR